MRLKKKKCRIAIAILVVFISTTSLRCNISKSADSEKEMVPYNFQKLKIQNTPQLNNFKVNIEQVKNDHLFGSENNITILLTLENGNNYPISFITKNCYPFEEIDENEFKIVKTYSCNANFNVIRTLRPKEKLTQRLNLTLKTVLTKLTLIINLQPTLEKGSFLNSNVSDYRLEPIIKKRSNHIQLITQL